MNSLEMENPGTAGTVTRADTGAETFKNGTAEHSQRLLHEQETVGRILQRMKLSNESTMTDSFDLTLSLRLDALEVQAEVMRGEGTE